MDWIAVRGARVRPSRRFPLVRRVLWRLTRESLASRTNIETNMGIDSSLSVSLPSDSGPGLLYGRPSDIVGEKGAVKLCTLLSPRAGTFVDVGAHLGLFTFAVGMNSPAPARQFFFEPNPALFARLRANCEKNGMDAVQGFSAALGASAGMAEFFLDVTDSSQSSLKALNAHCHELSPVQVDVWTWSDLQRDKGINRAVVKVDVENAEEDFLAGVGDAQDSIAYLIIEILGPAHAAGFVAKAEKQLGMNAYYVNDMRLESWRTMGFRYVPPQLNWLFCREAPADLRRLLTGTGFEVAE